MNHLFETVQLCAMHKYLMLHVGVFINSMRDWSVNHLEKLEHLTQLRAKTQVARKDGTLGVKVTHSQKCLKLEWATC